MLKFSDQYLEVTYTIFFVFLFVENFHNKKKEQKYHATIKRKLGNGKLVYAQYQVSRKHHRNMDQKLSRSLEKKRSLGLR